MFYAFSLLQTPFPMRMAWHYQLTNFSNGRSLDILFGTWILGTNHFNFETTEGAGLLGDLVEAWFFFKTVIHSFIFFIILEYVLEWYFFLPPTLCMIFLDGVEKVGFPL